MEKICRDIFKAIHEGKWMQIEYRNQRDEVTRYWIGIRSLDVRRESLEVDGMHLQSFQIQVLDRIYIRSILSSQLLEGTYYPVNKALVEDIATNPCRYRKFFDSPANLKILTYLEMCNRLDTTPYKKDFALLRYLDNDLVRKEVYPLQDQQFAEIVRVFQRQGKAETQNPGKLKIQKLGMNVLNIDTPHGLYVMAYRALHLNVKKRCLFPDADVCICKEFTLDGGYRESIRKYLDADDYALLDSFEQNQERIKDLVSLRTGECNRVDDMPYIIGIESEVLADLRPEYEAIMRMMEEGEAAYPLRAFFGKLLDKPRRRKVYPFALLDPHLNLDQLLAIHNAMRGPLAYVQGPPGTGKTSTIINAMMTAFFNGKTVLFASYNNAPVDGVVRRLTGLRYQGKPIPFPILRVGNMEKVEEAISRIKALYEMAVEGAAGREFAGKGRKSREASRKEAFKEMRAKRLEHARQIAALLRDYEELLDLKEHREALERMVEYNDGAKLPFSMMPFSTDLSGRQLQKVDEEIRKHRKISEEDVRPLLHEDQDAFLQILYETSLMHIRRLSSPQFAPFRQILYKMEGRGQVDAFNQYLQNSENLRRLQKAFPLITTSCISAHRLGRPETLFDLCILDEASQCNTAVSLMPILRGENLMLVGDPQQLNPVIVLDGRTNEILKRRYLVPEEYDYKKNSIYKVFLACDSVSDEILLRKHYRCRESIIAFNNQKYYHSRLEICTGERGLRLPEGGAAGKESGRESDGAASYVSADALLYFDNPRAESRVKNTSPGEVWQVVQYAKQHKNQSIAVITPFVNQRKMIEEALQAASLPHVHCGTVHAFQGDEKDVVLFSTAISNHTHEGTYKWLKNNKELINVATSRAKDRLVVLSDTANLDRLHARHGEERDDLYELVSYVRSKGRSRITPVWNNSRALGIKPFSTEMEEAFLLRLRTALENLWLSQNRFSVHKEVAISQVFQENLGDDELFYMGRFDFVIYERQGRAEIPVLAVELDGKEHYSDEAVQARDRRKNEICARHHLMLIRVENAYARRYNHIKRILESYFAQAR